MTTENEELWIKNERDHAEIKASIAMIQATVNKTMDIIPLIFKWCVFPLIIVLGTIIGADQILTRLAGG